MSGSTTRRSSFALGTVVNRFVAQQRNAHIAQQRVPMRAVTRELSPAEMVTHIKPLAYETARATIGPRRSTFILPGLRQPFLRVEANPPEGLSAPLPQSDHIPLFIVLPARRRPPVQAHAQHQAMALQHFLDLGERLLAEVWRAQQLDFGPLLELTVRS